jgi:hypothetical protein
MIHAKGLTVIGLFGIFATAMPNAAAAQAGAGAAAVQHVAPDDVVLAQDRTQRPRRATARRNLGQINAMSPIPEAVIPSAPLALYQQGDPCRFIYPCSMSNNLD